ncbi:MAG: alpha/beta fold hydrolase [Candidatus Hydrogenedentes bacterium]|nr:alpha/beta fold hydrolase [Candidatus Hydrogenedentota bacterium]
MRYIDASGAGQPVAAIPDWNIRRAHILANMQQVMGPFPEREKPDFDIEIVAEVDFPTYTRREIRFTVEPGDRLPAYLMIPKGLTGKTAGILALHQTYTGGKEEPAGVSGMHNRHYGHELAERGYVVIAPDYPGYGDYKIDAYAMGYASATMKGIWNHMRCVDLLQSLPEVDPARIGAIGHSLGGHNTLYVGAFDPRIQVMVTSCGFNRFAKYYGGNLKGWSHQGYMPRILSEYDADPAKMPFDFTEILGVLAPRAVFINAPLHDENFEVSGVEDCVTAATPVYELFSAAHKLHVAYPEAEHDFPPAQRSAAYAVIAETIGE